MSATVIAVALVVLVARPWRTPSVRRPAPTSTRAPRPGGEVVLRWPATVVIAGAGLLAGGIALALLTGGTSLATVPVARRWQRRRARAAAASAVPDLVDLFLVAASAGQPVAGSLAVVARRAPEAIGPSVAAADDRFRRGLPLAECLDGLGVELGPSGAPLTDALRQAAATGVPLVPLLSGVAATARDARRRRSQEVARRLPVTMLFPLVACILPAAIALAVVPVLFVSVSSLRP